jgi:hypothetical protein
MSKFEVSVKEKKREGEGGKTKKRTNGGQKDAGGDDRITSNDMPQSIGDTHCNDDDERERRQLQSAPPTLLFFPAARNESEARQELDFVERERERERERVLMLKTLAGILILKTFVPLKKS